MGYVIPAFPIKADIWHGYDPAISAYSAPDLGTFGNLSPGKRTFNGFIAPATTFFSHTVYPFPMELLVPALTDVRATVAGALPDLIEFPHGTGRFYLVQYVDDIGKGFANEHRFVMMYRLIEDCVFTDITIPSPIPLP